MKKASIAIALSAFLAISAIPAGAETQYIKNYQRSPIGTSTRYNYGSVENIGYDSKWPTNWPSGVRGYQCSAWPSTWGARALPDYNNGGSDNGGPNLPNGWVYRDSMTAPSNTAYSSWTGEGNTGVNGVKYAGSLSTSGTATSTVPTTYSTNNNNYFSKNNPATGGFTGYQYAWWNRTSTDGSWEPAWPGYMQPNWWPYRWQGLKSSGFLYYNYKPYASSIDPTSGWPKAAPDYWVQSYQSTGPHTFGSTSGVSALTIPSEIEKNTKAAAAAAAAATKTAALKITADTAIKTAISDFNAINPDIYSGALVVKSSGISTDNCNYTVTLSYFDKDSGAAINECAYYTIDGNTGRIGNRSFAVVQFTRSFIQNAASEISRGNFSAAEDIFTKASISTMQGFRFRELFNEIKRAAMASVMKGGANSEKIARFFDLRN